MRRLQIIPDSFPGPIYALTAEGKPDVKPDVSASDLKLLEEIKDHVSTEFKDVITEELSKKPLSGPEMTIELKDEKIRPRCTVTTKPVPAYHKEDAATPVSYTHLTLPTIPLV